jgi:hypothetical protein
LNKKNILILPVFAVLIFAVTSHEANANTTIAGIATNCIAITTCTFAITGGSASTSAGSISFKLPGETLITHAAPYSVTYPPYAGGWHVTELFTVIDANNGKVVTITTDAYVKATGHSGRGGGITYSLDTSLGKGGRITFNLTNLDGTTTTVTCNPSSVPSGNSSVCTVKVSDPANLSSIPTSTVTLSSSNTLIGTFSSASCSLSTGSCSVNFVTNQEYGPGTTSIYVAYNGDSTHYASAARTVLYATASVTLDGSED